MTFKLQNGSNLNKIEQIEQQLNKSNGDAGTFKELVMHHSGHWQEFGAKNGKEKVIELDLDENINVLSLFFHRIPSSNFDLPEEAGSWDDNAVERIKVDFKNDNNIGVSFQPDILFPKVKSKDSSYHLTAVAPPDATKLVIELVADDSAFWFAFTNQLNFTGNVISSGK